MDVGKIKGKACPVCGAENVHIDLGTAHLVDEDNKNLLDYKIWTCTCHSCGAPVYNEKMEEQNRKLDAEAVRALSSGRLSLKQIRGLPQRYAISRKDFCSVMAVPKTVMDDLDEVPFRMFDGDLPDTKLEERLTAVYFDPKKWIEFLGMAKDRLDKAAYEKSYNKAMGMIEQ